MWYFRTFADLIPASRYGPGESFYAGLHEALRQQLAAYSSGEVTFRQICEESPLAHAFCVGDPNTVGRKLVDLLGSYEGMTDVLCWTRLGGLSQRHVMQSMELLVYRVIRPLREGKAARSRRAAP